MVYLGQTFLGIALLGAFVAMIAFFWGRSLGPKHGAGITRFGYWSTFGVAISMTLSSLVMIRAFFAEDFKFMYVAENHSPDTSGLAWLYKLSGLWAGREGSLLFWAWMLTLFAAWVAYRRYQQADELSNMGLAITNLITGLFGIAMMFSEPNNPFKVTPDMYLLNGQLTGQATAWGMNPLLQHWAMILHPPTLFIGYAGLTIPFAFAIAALIINDGSSRWVEIVDRITVFSWLFLGAGIGLGSIWAYVVLGWGGYWAWDPVENASLLPWLTGVGLLHSFTVYKRRDGFKRWAVMMAAFTFALVILGTFITRSGVVQSVHAFSKDPLSKYLFQFMIYGSVLAAGAGLIARWKTFAGNDEFESLTSKEAAYYFNNVIMLVAGLLVAYMTVTSAIPTLYRYESFNTDHGTVKRVSWMITRTSAEDPETHETKITEHARSQRYTPAEGAEWLQEGTSDSRSISFPPFSGESIPSTSYESLARPIGVLYILILAFCPILSWRKTEGRQILKRIAWPLVGTAVLFALLCTEWWMNLRPIYSATIAGGGEGASKLASYGPRWLYDTITLVGFFAASLVISTTVGLFVDGVRKRMASKGENVVRALGNILTKARTQSGGYITHIGMGIIVIGLVGSSMFVRDVTVAVKAEKGKSFEVGGYRFEYKDSGSKQLESGDTLNTAKFEVSRGGKVVGIAEPSQTTYALSGQQRLNAYVLSEPLRDVFLALQPSSDDTEVALNVKINPLIWFAWGGFGVLLLGTALAAWSKRRPALEVVSTRRPQADPKSSARNPRKR